MFQLIYLGLGLMFGSGLISAIFNKARFPRKVIPKTTLLPRDGAELSRFRTTRPTQAFSNALTEVVVYYSNHSNV